jgi:hypothetical protein
MLQAENQRAVRVTSVNMQVLFPSTHPHSESIKTDDCNVLRVNQRAFPSYIVDEQDMLHCEASFRNDLCTHFLDQILMKTRICS